MFGYICVLKKSVGVHSVLLSGVWLRFGDSGPLALLPAPVDSDRSLSSNHQKPQAAAFSFAVYKEGSEKASFFLSELKT